MSEIVKRIANRIRMDLFEPPADQFGALNGMRGISAYLVICFHVAIFSGNFPLVGVSKAELNSFHRAINGFWTGLDVFFVLSGFLIARILMTSLQRTGSVEFWAFFTRRSMRIFPAYYLVLTVAIFWYIRYAIGHPWFLLAGGSWEELRSLSWQNYSYTLNYFFQSGEANPMHWAWSLCVEEHFYLLLPLALGLIFRSKRPGFRPTVLWIWMLLPLLIRAGQYLYNPEIVLLDGFYYRSHNRFDELLYGVLVAYYYVHHHDAFERVVTRLGHGTWSIGLALIGIVWTFGGLQEQGAFAVVFQFNLMALGAALVMMNGLFNDNFVTRFLQHAFWYPIARVSYGIYLVHCYVLFFVMKRAGFRSFTTLEPWDLFLFFLVVMAGSILIAALMFLLLERPLIDYGRRLGQRFAKPPLATSGSRG